MKQKRKLVGVEFELKRDGTEEIYNEKTNENGEIIFKNLFPGKYFIAEKKTGKEYRINNDLIEVNVEYNKQSEITVENEKIKGSIKVIKTDKENPEIKISGVKFELYDEQLNSIETLETNENGEAFSKEYPSVGKKYYLKEIETNEKYNLNEELIEIELENNSQKEIVVKNELKKGWLRIIKQDLENENVRLSGVQFELYDEDMNLLETLETDEKGEVISKEYPAVGRKYYLKEIKTIDGYVLDSEPKEVFLANGVITDVFIKNAKEPKESKTITIEKEVEPEIIVIEKEVDPEIVEPEVIIKEIEPEPIYQEVIIGEPRVIKKAVKLPKTGM